MMSVLCDLEQLGHSEAQSIRESRNRDEARVAGSALHISDVGPVQAGFVAEIRLSKALFAAKLPNGISKPAPQSDHLGPGETNWG